MNKLSRTKNLPIIVVILLLVALVLLVPLTRPTTTQAFAQAEQEIYYCDNGYAGAGTPTEVTETINYTTKQASELITLNSSFPAYTMADSSTTNGCAPIAGSNLIGYFDRFYEDLIPDCSPGRLFGSIYRYYGISTNNTQIQALINDLYVRMGTNTQGAGTTQAQYKAGLTSYVNSKSLSISFESVMTNGALDVDKINQALTNGKVISLYLSGYNVTLRTDSNGVATLAKTEFDGTHIMMVYGCQTVNYYDANNTLVASKTYLNISSGISQSLAYYVVNNNGLVVAAEASAIY